MWVRVPRSVLGGGDPPADAPTEEMHLREQVFQQHDRFLQALLLAHLDGVLGTIHDRAASAVHDYVEDTGTLTSLVGEEAHADYFRAFFDKFEVVSVEPLYRAAEDWYVFAEIRVAANVKSGSEAGRSVRVPHCRVPRPGQRRKVHRPNRARYRPGLAVDLPAELSDLDR